MPVLWPAFFENAIRPSEDGRSGPSAPRSDDYFELRCHTACRLLRRCSRTVVTKSLVKLPNPMLIWKSCSETIQSDDFWSKSFENLSVNSTLSFQETFRTAADHPFKVFYSLKRTSRVISFNLKNITLIDLFITSESGRHHDEIIHCYTALLRTFTCIFVDKQKKISNTHIFRGFWGK